MTDNLVSSDVAAKREKAEKKDREATLMLLIGSPMCRALSRLQELNYSKVDPLEAQRMAKYEILHLCLCVKLHLVQMKNGWYSYTSTRMVRRHGTFSA